MVSLIAALTFAPLVHRWFYIGTNLQVDANCEKLKTLMVRASKVGYNGFVIADTKFQIMDIASPALTRNVKDVLALAKTLKMEVIPSVFSVGWASAYGVLDPNVYEGLPVRDALYICKGKKLVFQSELKESLKNGGFEQSNSDRLTDELFQDEPGKSSFVDRNIFHSGKSSLRIENPTNNCRVCQTVTLEPWRQYRMTVWVATSEFSQPANVRAFALSSKGEALSYQSIPLGRTQGWTKFSLCFSSQAGGPTNLYAGVWGAAKGKLWFDDWSLEEVGLVNVVRRPAAPLVVRDSDGKVLAEGRDFAPISDPAFLKGNGNIRYDHDGPDIQGLSSKIVEGKSYRVSFTAAVDTDEGKPAMSLTDPLAISMLAHEASNVSKLVGAQSGFLISHDEIRVGGWSEPARPFGESVAASLSTCRNILRLAAPGCPLYVWSDMFDQFHNAKPNYYLCHGSLEGAWKGLSPDITVVNWNYGGRAQSMPFFAGLGCKQILAGYYDSDPVAIVGWLRDASHINGVNGVMYTTWQDNYRDLEKFAQLAWGR